MPNIDTYLAKIREAVYGEEVRGSIHDALQAVNNEVDSSAQGALRRSIAPAWSRSTAYEKDSYVWYTEREGSTAYETGLLYRSKEDIPANTDWDSSKWQRVYESSEIYRNANDIIKVQNEQPTEKINKIWIKDRDSEVSVPTWDEHRIVGYLYNFEQGTFNSSGTDSYIKKGARHVIRNIVPFYAKAGTVLETKSGYKFLFQMYDTDWHKIGQSEWVTRYTLLNTGFCYAVATTNADTAPTLTPDDAKNIYTDDTLSIMCANTAIPRKVMEDAEDFNVQIKRSTYIYNFEQGGLNGWDYPSKDNRNNMTNRGRNKALFYAKEGDLIEVKNTDYEFTLIVFDENLKYVNHSNWETSHTLVDSFYCYILFRAKSGVTINIPDDISNIFTDDTINLMCSRVLLSELVDDNNENTDSRMKSSTCMYNFEQGTFTSSGPRYRKISSYTSGRNIAPFYAKKGTTIATTNENYVFNMVTYDENWNKTGSSDWVSSFTLTNSRYCFLAFVSRNGTTVTVPGDAEKMFTAESIDVMCSNVAVSRSVEETVSALKDEKLYFKEAVVYDFPKSIIVQPEITYSARLPQNSGVSAAKGAIYKNGNNFCVTYGENVDGTADDFPEVTSSGVLQMKYKYFQLINGVESNISYGTFAKRGDNYIDYSGNSAVFTGGCGLPSGVNNLQYFTSAYTGTKTYNGKEHYGMTPCCCTVTVSDNGVTFGPLRELTLNIDGTVGKFDVSRIDEASEGYSLYLTTAPPAYDGSKYHWLQPIRISAFEYNAYTSPALAYCTSVDGINWVFKKVIPVPFYPVCEVMCSYANNHLIFAARTDTQVDNISKRSAVYVGSYDILNDYIVKCYRLWNVSSRSYIVRTGEDFLLFYTPYQRNITECLRIVDDGDGAGFIFYKWFTLVKNASWYTACNEQTISDSIFNKMYVIGGNDEGPSIANGMNFLELTVSTDGPRTMRQVDSTIF